MAQMKQRPPLIRRSTSSVANEDAHVAVYGGDAGDSFDKVAQLLAPITDPVDSAANAYDQVRLRVGGLRRDCCCVAGARLAATTPTPLLSP